MDKYLLFLRELRRSAAVRVLAARIPLCCASMTDLPFSVGTFDVVWSEGAIFIIGFAKGLTSWRRLLAPGGHMVVSDFCWLKENPPAELQEMFIDGSADVGDVAARRKTIAENGYQLLGDFVLPAAGWWDNYYVPLADCLERFRASHAADPEALDVAARSQHEIDLYRKYPEYFGYVFFLMTPGA